jgi:hypothetical protein
MKPITQEWISKAEGDFATAQRELQAQEMPNYDAVCFHCQQCIEKYLKAYLQGASHLCEWRGLRPRHSHKWGESAHFAGAKRPQNERFK